MKLTDKIGESCRIIHTKSGLFFNGYDTFYNRDISSKGKNTLSQTNFKRILTFKKSDSEILEKAFENNIIIKEYNKKYIRNVIVFEGSEVMKTLSEHYDVYDYLPIEDFSVERM